ncbi:kinase [Marinobacter caseinilyticus]|uniref:kinase n=1 Tax=Marinobacter caseinilyticus TaxID=2692195 RepID=UPI0014076585|nr:kinase [Marinobacter caseinilyticus]
MSQPEARFTIRSLFITAVATIIATVLALQVSGRISHPGDQTDGPIGDFTAVHVNPGEDFRMSSKPSELHAMCDQGYLTIAADVDPQFRGLLVDYKNRGVRCHSAGSAPVKPAS